MSEIYPSDSELQSMSGASDAAQEVLYVPVGQSPYHVSFYRMLYRLLDVARRAGDLRVYKDGDMTFGVRAGRFADGSAAVDFAGAAAQPLTDNAVNCIYLGATGALGVSLAQFPDPLVTPHIPLAAITVAGGSYELGDLDDCRGRAMFALSGGLSVQSLRQSAPQLAITAGPEDQADTRRISVQVKDAAGSDLAGRYMVSLWCSQADYGAPGGTQTLALVSGTAIQAIAANQHLSIVTNADGRIELDAVQAGAATNYFMAQLGRKVYSSGQVDWAA